MKKIKKPIEIMVMFYTRKPKQNNPMHFITLDKGRLNQAKRLHKWLGQAIAYLEQQKKETKNG